MGCAGICRLHYALLFGSYLHLTIFNSALYTSKFSSFSASTRGQLRKRDVIFTFATVWSFCVKTSVLVLFRLFDIDAENFRATYNFLPSLDQDHE